VQKKTKYEDAVWASYQEAQSVWRLPKAYEFVGVNSGVRGLLHFSVALKARAGGRNDDFIKREFSKLFHPFKGYWSRSLNKVTWSDNGHERKACRRFHCPSVSNT
jgi:hypothetical protein